MKQLLAVSVGVAVLVGWLPTPTGSAPAARQGDYQACPLPCSPFLNHIGGAIVSGESTVLICGQPAARVSDLALCSCSSTHIILGSTTVLIGGLPAARLGDPTDHGGVIQQGCANVLIGP